MEGAGSRIRSSPDMWNQRALGMCFLQLKVPSITPKGQRFELVETEGSGEHGLKRGIGVWGTQAWGQTRYLVAAMAA